MPREPCPYWLERAEKCGVVAGRVTETGCGGDQLKCPTILDAHEGRT